MKTLLIAMLMVGTVQAGEVGVTLFEKSAISNTEVKSWRGLQLEYQFDSPWYVFGGYEKAIMPGFAYTMLGAGGGLKYQVTEHISLFGQAGYYFIDNNVGRTTEFNEAIYYDLNSSFKNSMPGPYDHGDYWFFDEYEVVNSDAFGGALGFEISYPLNKKWDIGFVGTLHIMTVHQEIRGYRDEWTAKWPGSSWEKTGSVNMSAFSFGLNLSRDF